MKQEESSRLIMFLYISHKNINPTHSNNRIYTDNIINTQSFRKRNTRNVNVRVSTDNILSIEQLDFSYTESHQEEI